MSTNDFDIVIVGVQVLDHSGFDVKEGFNISNFWEHGLPNMYLC